MLERDLDRTPRGESFGSVHVQTDDLPAVERNVRVRPAPPRQVEGVGDRPTAERLDRRLRRALRPRPPSLPRLARELSDALGVVVIQLAVEEGAVARYRIYDRGRMLDEYLSVPEYYGPLPSGEVVALAANPTLVERLTGGDRRAVREAAVQVLPRRACHRPTRIVATSPRRCGSRAPSTATRRRASSGAILIDR